MKTFSRALLCLLPLLCMADRSVFALSHAQLLNGGFDDVSGDGRAREWTYDSTFYSLDRSGGRNGTAALHFKGDSGSPVLQRVKVSPGVRYRFGVWVRTRNLQGKGFGARICVLWEDSYGRWLDGCFKTPRIKGTTNDWVRCESSVTTAPKGAAWATVRPEVVAPISGEAWFDDVFFEPYDQKPVFGLFSSAYRDEQDVGCVTFSASLRSVGAVRPRRGVFSFVGKDGKMCERSPDEMSALCAKITLPVSMFPVGRTQVSFRLLAADGRENLGNATLDFTRLSAPKKRKVSFDRLRRTLIDGKAFFPLGMYWSVAKPYHSFKLPKINAETIAKYASGPFNCVMPYEMPDREQMDLCHRHGLKVIYSLITRFGGNDWDVSGVDHSRRHSPAAVKRIEEFRNHPALLAWYVNDERSVKEMPNLIGRYRTVKELDPDHPAWAVLYQIDELGDYMGSFDVLGTDPYPIGHYPISTAWVWADAARRSSMGIRPIWQVPQAFDWTVFRKDAVPSKTDRMPTREEMVNMIWQQIAAGANGIVCYSYTYMLQSPNAPVDKALSDTFAAAQTVRDQFEVLLSDGDPPAVSVDSANVAVRAWRQGKKSFVVAVNKTRSPVSAKLKLDADFSRYAVRFGGGEMKNGGGCLELSLGQLGVCLVEATN